MGMGRALAERWNRVNAEVLGLQASASNRAGIISSLTKFVRLTLQVGILGMGAWLVLQQQLSAGSMVAASIIMGRALAPVEQAIGTWKQTIGAREAWGRLNNLFDAPLLRPSRMQLPRPLGRLTVEGVRYAPPGAAAPVLKGLSLAVEPSNALAIIGPSAAGKSTLARLLVGLGEPQAGNVRLDGADVFAWNRDDFGQYVGYLPQDVELFPGSVGENIARMSEGNPTDIVAAAQMAGVHEMILRLPKGYDTEIGEGGAMLSGGQRQRIGLARALYRNPVLVVLDEPNASLDAAGEQALNDAIAAMKANGSTVVVIAHRPSLMTHIDLVAVLNDGQLTMFGPRDGVLAQLSRPAGPPGPPQVRVLNTQGTAS
jgi:ATP-binding cassette subfamily C protein/ATP-binding cassette subfamily C protein EexD